MRDDEGDQGELFGEGDGEEPDAEELERIKQYEATYEALSVALGGPAQTAGIEEPADLFTAFPGRTAPSQIARILEGIGDRLPAAGTAARRRYDTLRKEIAAVASGRRPSSKVMARIVRSAKSGRLAGSRGRAAKLKRKGGGVSVSGDVLNEISTPYVENRTMPASDFQHMKPDRWRRILAPWERGDRAGTGKAFDVEFSEAYGAKFHMMNVEITIDPKAIG